MSRAHFDADLARLSDALESGGWIVQADGFSYIAADAPAGLVSAYHELLQYGYAAGLI